MDKTKQTNTKKPIDQESQKVIDLEVKEVQKVIDQEVQGTQEVIDQADLDLTKYVILEGKSQGNYEYPDLLVSIDLLTIGQAWSTIKQDEAHLNHYNITLERKNDPLTCITWNQAHKILDGLENKLIENKKPVMLNPKQFIDLIQSVHKGKLHLGTGDFINFDALKKLKYDFHYMMATHKYGEFIDAQFKLIEDQFIMNFDHKIQEGELVPTYSIPVTNCLQIFQPGQTKIKKLDQNTNETGLFINSKRKPIFKKKYHENWIEFTQIKDHGTAKFYYDPNNPNKHNTKVLQYHVCSVMLDRITGIRPAFVK